MFRYEPTKYSDKNPVLDKYFGPEIDVLLAMTAKIMKANGKVVHLSTYRGIKQDDNSNLAYISLRNEFDVSIRDIYGLDILHDDFPEVNLEDTPLYGIHEENTTDAEGDLVDTPEDDETPVMDT